MKVLFLGATLIVNLQNGSLSRRNDFSLPYVMKSGMYLNTWESSERNKVLLSEKPSLYTFRFATKCVMSEYVATPYPNVKCTLLRVRGLVRSVKIYGAVCYYWSNFSRIIYVTVDRNYLCSDFLPTQESHFSRAGLSSKLEKNNIKYSPWIHNKVVAENAQLLPEHRIVIDVKVVGNYGG